jgi:hypothetical protein
MLFALYVIVVIVLSSPFGGKTIKQPLSQLGCFQNAQAYLIITPTSTLREHTTYGVADKAVT